MVELEILKKESEVHERLTKKGERYQSIGYISEDAFLSDCMSWMRKTYPQLYYFVFHIANEGYSSDKAAQIRASQNKTKGVLPGVFDVLSVWQGRMRWAEFKLSDKKSQKNGGLSDYQKILYDKWFVKPTMIYSFSDWKNWIENIVLNQIDIGEF